MVEGIVLMEAVQIGEGRVYGSLLQIITPSIGLVRARIVQQNTDRGRQDHFHFFRSETGLL